MRKLFANNLFDLKTVFVENINLHFCINIDNWIVSKSTWFLGLVSKYRHEIYIHKSNLTKDIFSLI